MYLFQYFELLGLVTSLICIRRLRGTPFIYSVPYMILVVFVDVVSSHLPLYVNGSNQWLFNLYLPFQNLFFSYLFLKSFKEEYMRRIVQYGVIAFMLFYIFNLTMLQGFWAFNNYSFVFTCVLLILYSNLFFLSFLKTDLRSSLFTHPMFWISASCLLFFTSFSLFFAVYFTYKDSMEAFREHHLFYSIITKYGISTHYLLLSIALVFVRRQHV
jgi:hypothetical protein